MLNWFASKAPLSTADKAWTERRMFWLSERLGRQRLLRAEMILPTPEFFPDNYAKDEANVRSLLDRLGGFMGIATATLTLAIRDDEQMPGAAGHFLHRERSEIAVARSQLDDPVRLVATLAHELAHEALLGGRLLSADVPDHEFVTDLLPVFLGLGIFLANATVREAYRDAGGVSWWQMSRHGYLPAQVLGYALALFAFVRDELNPPWATYLRRDAREVLESGLKFLRKTGDTLFHRDTAARKYQPPTASAVVEKLQTGTPTVRLNALWDIHEEKLVAGPVLEAVYARLDDRDPDVRAEAFRTLGIFGAAAASALPRLIDALHQGPLSLRVNAAGTLGALGLDGERIVPELRYVLGDDQKSLVCAAAAALVTFEAQAQSAVPDLLAALEAALVDCDDWLSNQLLQTLSAVSADAQQELEAHFADRDVDFRRQVRSLFRTVLKTK